MTIKYSGDNITFSDSSIQSTAATGFGFKNRILNGDMRIDQRNAGASVTPTVDNTFTLDRWSTALTVASKFSIQQSSTAAAGFTNSLLVTSLSAYSVGAGDIFALKHTIEGFNVADLGFGAAGASTVTLSFWVRSSLTGTFGGALQNGAQNRSYPFSFTINSANTFEYKTVTIAGDTSGTWVTNNGKGLSIWFSLGTGTTYSGTANAWTSNLYFQPTGSTSVVGTNGATFYITGVQLEKGSTATSFDYRPYSTELALCQRYYFDLRPSAGVATYPASNENGSAGGGWVANINFPVPMRTTPTLNAPGTYTATGNFRLNWPFAGSSTISALTGLQTASPYSMEMYGTKTSAVFGAGYFVPLEVNSALTSTIGASAEL